MEKKKVITKKEILNERLDNSAYADKIEIEQLFTKYMGEYQPDEFSPRYDNQITPKSKEKDMGEGKLFTKLLTGK
jgi:hypothetical protein